MHSARATMRRRVRKKHWQLQVAVRQALRLPPPEAVARVMFEFARAHPNAFVVQIGAHDASQLDPLNRYIRTRGWRGILVEPIPFVFERLRSNYSDVEGLIFENVAIAQSDGQRELYFIPPTTEPGLPPWYDALASFRRDILAAHKEFIADIDDRIQSMNVPCLTFDSLCNRHGVEEIDVIQIDTEGYDLEILRMVDFDRYRPTLVQFEELHMTSVVRQEAQELLARHGFESLSNGMDCICLAPQRLGPSDRRLLRLWNRLLKAGSV